jgi:hypothetical protein
MLPSIRGGSEDTEVGAEHLPHSRLQTDANSLPSLHLLRVVLGDLGASAAKGYGPGPAPWD